MLLPVMSIAFCCVISAVRPMCSNPLMLGMVAHLCSRAASAGF
jgi:hypothetical protein